MNIIDGTGATQFGDDHCNRTLCIWRRKSMHEIFEEDNRKAYKEDMNRFGLLREYVG